MSGVDDFSAKVVLTSGDKATGTQYYSCTDKPRQSDRRPEMSGMDDFSTGVVLTRGDRDRHPETSGMDDFQAETKPPGIQKCPEWMMSVLKLY